MSLALGAGAIVLAVLLWELAAPALKEAARSRRVRALKRRRAPEVSYDPGRELRAEQRARALLRSCVNEEEWAMYRDLGFLRVWGRLSNGDPQRAVDGPRVEEQQRATGLPSSHRQLVEPRVGADYAYLIYPHKPILAYLPQTGLLLNEYCVAFPDLSRPYGSVRLPDSDDVLAKWMALVADERALIADANMHLPGRQVDPDRIRRDLRRLARWERERLRSSGRDETRCAGSVPAP
jgi:hypothetical protein